MNSIFEKGKTVTFTIQIEDGKGREAQFETQVNGVEAEDGSREAWRLYGFIVAINAKLIEWRRFRAYFDTRRRKGHFTFQ